MRKVLYYFYVTRLGYLINFKKSSVKVNKEIYRLHMKLNSMEKHLN